MGDDINVSQFPYLVKTNPRGKDYYYVRIASGEQHFPVKGKPGSKEFMINYNKALEQAKKERDYPEVKTFNTHKIGWLVKEYLDSAEFADYAFWTKRNKSHSMKIICEKLGDTKYNKLEKRHVTEVMQTLRDTPSMANQFLSDFRVLIDWSVNRGFIEENIARFIKPLPYKRQPHKKWTEEEETLLVANFDYDTQERLAFELLSDLGARVSDIICIGPRNIHGDILRYTSAKTGVDVAIYMSEDLQKAIKSQKFIGKTFIVSPCTKQPFINYKNFSAWFQRRAVNLGIRKPIHGMRKTVACRQLKRGATHAQVKATQGWISDQMVTHYSREIDREEMGLEASHFLHRTSSTQNHDPENDKTP